MEKTPGGTSLVYTLKHHGSVGSDCCCGRGAPSLRLLVCIAYSKKFWAAILLTADREPSACTTYIVPCIMQEDREEFRYYLAIDIYGGLDYFSTPDI